MYGVRIMGAVLVEILQSASPSEDPRRRVWGADCSSRSSDAAEAVASDLRAPEDYDDAQELAVR